MARSKSATLATKSTVGFADSPDAPAKEDTPRLVVRRKLESPDHTKSFNVRVLSSKSSKEVPDEALVVGACDESEAIRMYCVRLGVESRLFRFRTSKAAS